MADPVLIARTRARDALDPSGLMVFELVAAWCDAFQLAMTWLCSGCLGCEGEHGTHYAECPAAFRCR